MPVCRCRPGAFVNAILVSMTPGFGRRDHLYRRRGWQTERPLASHLFPSLCGACRIACCASTQVGLVVRCHEFRHPCVRGRSGAREHRRFRRRRAVVEQERRVSVLVEDSGDAVQRKAAHDQRDGTRDRAGASVLRDQYREECRRRGVSGRTPQFGSVWWACGQWRHSAQRWVGRAEGTRKSRCQPRASGRAQSPHVIARARPVPRAQSNPTRRGRSHGAVRRGFRQVAAVVSQLQRKTRAVRSHEGGGAAAPLAH